MTRLQRRMQDGQVGEYIKPLVHFTKCKNCLKGDKDLYELVVWLEQKLGQRVQVEDLANPNAHIREIAKRIHKGKNNIALPINVSS